MQETFLQVTMIYSRQWEETAEALLAESDTLGTQTLDSATVAQYEADHPDWELADAKAVHAAWQREVQQATEETAEEDEVIQLVFFSDDAYGHQALERLERLCYEQYGGEIRILQEKRVDNSHWEEEWKKTYRPLSLGKTMEIVPSWLEPTDTTRLPIFIEPGMAFGTGTHETTALCLEALERLSLAEKSGLDLGTGSGILAIYKKKRGMREVLATDISADALRSARNNAKRNQVDILFLESDLLANVEGRFDVLVSNILAEPLLRLLPDVSRVLNPKANLVLSGLLATQQEEICSALSKLGFLITRQTVMGEWASVEAVAPTTEKIDAKEQNDASGATKGKTNETMPS